jgi:hypothetical protein
LYGDLVEHVLLSPLAAYMLTIYKEKCVANVITYETIKASDLRDRKSHDLHHLNSHLVSSLVFLSSPASNRLSSPSSSSTVFSSAVFTLSLCKTFLNSLNHLIAHTSSLWEARSKVRLYLFKLAAVTIHVAKGNTFRPVLF